jgi:uncharacterized membrane protein HdeD (DUF308 family)
MGYARRSRRVTHLPWQPPRWWMIFCGAVSLVAGVGMWALLYYMALTH